MSRYGGITGSKKISEDWDKINTAFDNIEADVDAKAAIVNTHISNQSIHVTQADHNKLDGIEAGAEANQNAFSRVNGMNAESPTDEFTIVGDVGVTVTQNPNDKSIHLTVTGDSAPGAHAATHLSGGSDPIPAATPTTSGLMPPESFQAIEDNTTALADVTAQLADLAQDIVDVEKRAKTYREKQTFFLGELYRKLRVGTFPVTLCFQGDSIIYGYDINSSDKRPADSTPAGDGSTHVRERAGKTITEAIGEFLGSVYGSGNLTVINRGFSGDTTQTSYNHWPVASGADVNLIMLGTNDSGNNVGLDVFLYWYRKTIERELENDTPIILLTPTKKRSATDLALESYANAVYDLGDEYGIPVVDMQEMLANVGFNSYSDNAHFNTKGYTYIASRLSSLFIGAGVLNKKVINNKSTLSVRPNVDNVKYSSGVTFSTTTGYSGPDELAVGQGIAAFLHGGDSLHYSFYADQPDLLFIPNIYFPDANTQVIIEIDFGVELPMVTNGYDRFVRSVEPTWRPTNPITLTKSDDNWWGTPSLRVYALPGLTDYQATKVAHITNKGWHTVKISCTDSGTQGVRLNTVDFLHLTDLLRLGQNGHLKLKTHASFSDTTDVPSTTIKMDDLMFALKYPPQTSYWENPPLRVMLYNWDNNILEYTIVVGNSGDTSTRYKLALDSREIKLVASPNSAQVRTLTGLSYNSTTRELTFNWGGATTRATEVTITVM